MRYLLALFSNIRVVLDPMNVDFHQFYIAQLALLGGDCPELLADILSSYRYEIRPVDWSRVSGCIHILRMGTISVT